MKASDYEKGFEDRPGRTAFKAAAVAIFVLVGIWALLWVVGIASLPFRTAAGVAERTLNPDSAIANYEWFKQQVQDVRAMDTRIAATEATFSASPAGGGWQAEQERARIGSILLGLRGQRAQMVADYNARSQMANRSIFRTGDLPERLE